MRAAEAIGHADDAARPQLLLARALERTGRLALERARRLAGVAAFFRKYLAIVVRKHVIGPPAEHPSRRIEHQAPLIASFLV